MHSRTTISAVQIDAGLSALVVGLAGARAGFVLLHWGYYSGKPIEILWFWQGGLSWIGGAAGSILGLTLYALISRRPFWPLADALAIPFAIIALSSWTGCLLDGCAYGHVVEGGLLTPPTLDMFGGQVPRWPTQMVGAVYSLAVLAAMYWLTGRSLRTGVIACLSASLIAAGALALSFTRSDPSLLLAGFRLDTVGSAVLLFALLSGLVWRILAN